MTAENDEHGPPRGQGIFAGLEHGRVLPVVEQQVTEDDHVKFASLIQAAEQRRGIRPPQVPLAGSRSEIQYEGDNVEGGRRLSP